MRAAFITTALENGGQLEDVQRPPGTAQLQRRARRRRAQGL
jgi:hypothetical protein